MITDADITKLKAVFATKNDLVAMEKRFDTKFATKDDLVSIKSDIVSIKSDMVAVKKDIVSIKSDMVAVKKDIVSIKSDIVSIKSDMVSMEKRLKKEIVAAIVEYLQANIIPILNEHERRLDRLEKHVGGFPSLA